MLRIVSRGNQYVMAVRNTQAALRPLVSEYDGDSDVLYISKTRAEPTVAKNNGTGIVVRYSMASPGQPCGVSIEKFKATGLAGDLGELAGVVARLLYVDSESVLAALERHR